MLEYVNNMTRRSIHVNFSEISGAVCAGILSFVRTVSVWNWLLKAAVCTLVVNGIYLLRYHKDPAFLDLLLRVKMVLHRSRDERAE